MLHVIYHSLTEVLFVVRVIILIKVIMTHAIARVRDLSLIQKLLITHHWTLLLEEKIRLVNMLIISRGGGGGTTLFGLYGDVPLDRVWFLASLS